MDYVHKVETRKTNLNEYKIIVNRHIHVRIHIRCMGHSYITNETNRYCMHLTDNTHHECFGLYRFLFRNAYTFNSIFLNYAFNAFLRFRKIREGQHPKREETLHDDHETQLTAGVDANTTSGVCSFRANGSNRDDSYVETSEVITDSFNKASNCEVSNALITNEDDDYVIPAEVTSEISRNKQHYEDLDVLRRNDDEHEYQPLGRISDVDGSNEIHGYVIPAETISEVTPCSSTTERNWEVFDAVTNEDDGYVIPAEVTSEISRNKQH